MSVPLPAGAWVDVEEGAGEAVDVALGVGEGSTVTVSPAAEVIVPTISAPQLLSNKAAKLIANVAFDVRTLNSTLRNSVKLEWQKLPKAKLHNSVNEM